MMSSFTLSVGALEKMWRKGLRPCNFFSVKRQQTMLKSGMTLPNAGVMLQRPYSWSNLSLKSSADGK
jgi:hypothetical protein